MKRTILAIVIASISVSSFAGEFSEKVNHDKRFNEHTMARAPGLRSGPVASQNPEVSRDMSGANVHGASLTAGGSYTKNDPTGTPSQNVNPIGSHNVSGYAPQSYSVATPGLKQQSVIHSVTVQEKTPTQDPAAVSAAAAAAVATPTKVEQATPAAPATTPATPSSVSVQTAPAAYSKAMETANVNGAINVSAASLKADTKVTTPTGEVTTAGAIAAVNPTAQISVPMDSAFAAPSRKGGHSENNRSNNSEHGTGNGGSNAQNSRSAGGLADSHVGGGRSGGGFHY